LTSQLLQTRLQSYATKLEQLTGAVQVFSTVMGNEALPALKAVTDGLTMGVMWLTENREAVSNLIEVLTKAGIGYIAFSSKIGLGNTALGGFSRWMWHIATSEATFSSKIGAMGNSVKGFGATVTATMAGIISRFMLWYLAIEGVSRLIGFAKGAYDDHKISAWDDRDRQRNYEPDVPFSQRDEAYRTLLDRRDTLQSKIRTHGTTVQDDSGNDYVVEQKETLQELEDQLADTEDKIAARQAKYANATDPRMRNLEKMNAEAIVSMKEKALREAGVQVPGVDLSKDGGNGPANPPDPAIMTRKRDQFALQQQYNELQNQSKISNLQYTDSLERLSMVEDVYGKTVSTNTARIDLRNYRIGQLGTQNRNAEDMLKSFEEQLDTAIAKDKDLSAQMKQVYVDWDNMSKAQKYEAVKDNNDLKGNYTLMKWLIDKVGELKVKLAELKGETNKVANENIKLATSGYFSREQTYNRNLEASNRNTSHATAMATNEYDPYNDKQLLAIRIQGAKANQKLYDAELLGLKAEFEAAKKAYDDEGDFKVKQSLLFQVEQTQLAYDKQRQIVERTTKEIADLEQSKNDKINSGMAGIVSDLAIQGNSLKDIWKNLWQGLAQEAINQLFRVKGAQSSVLGNLLGFGGGSSATKGLSDYVAMPTFGSSIPKFATGGRNNKETLAHISEGNKAEWIIPTADKQRGRQLWLQAGDELGMTTERVPYLKDPDLAQKFSSGGDGLSSTAHLAKLDMQNALMLQQNQMLAMMANNSQNSGGVTVITTQVSQEQILDVLKKNPQMLQGALRRANGMRA
jgi:hypothetical protein